MGVRLQPAEMSKRLVEKGTRNFKLERCTGKVTIIKAEATVRAVPGAARAAGL